MIGSVSGVDTVRGTWFQQAHALLAALDVLDDADLGSLRVEGTEDVVDIEIFGTDGKLRTGKQVKTRSTEYTWGKAALLKVFRRWAELPGVSAASFEFITDGRLGPTGQEVSDALDEAGAGRPETLAELLSEDPESPACELLARASVHVDSSSTEEVIARANRQVQAMLPSPHTADDARDEAEVAVNRLLVRMLGRTGDADPSRRVFTRAELAGILGVPADQPAGMRWPGRLRDRYLDAASSRELGPFAEALVGTRAPSMPLIRPVDDITSQPQPVTDLIQGTGPSVLAGRTGMGKSTAAELLRREGARQRRAVLVAHAEAYLPGRLAALAADAISEVLREDLPAATGRQALADRDVTLVIDGASEVPADIRQALEDELRAPEAAGSGARIILLGRDMAAVRSIFPASRPPAVYELAAFDRGRRLDLACRVLWGTGADDPENADRVAALQTDIDRADHVLGDAAGNPLLLTMAMSLIGQGVEFADRAGLYDGFIELLAQRSGADGIAIAAAALGIVYAALLDRERRFAAPIEWARLLADAARQLSAIGVQAEAGALSEAARRSGLVVPIGWAQTLVPIHDSFADYLAGTAHAQELAPLPLRAVPGDRQRLLFAAETGGAGQELTSLVTRDLPFLMVQLAPHDRRVLTESAPDELREILHRLDPGEDYGISLRKIGHGRIVATRDRRQWRWAEADDDAVLPATAPAVIVDDPRLLKAAVRIWRQSLLLRLTAPHTLLVPEPQTQDEACELLAEHLSAAARATRDLVAEIAPPGHVGVLEAQIGPLGLRAVVEAPELAFGAIEWPVSYQKAAAITVRKRSFDAGDPQDMGGHLSWGSTTLSHLTRSGPQATAVDRVRSAIEEMTIKGWLTP
jgi:hypothetical protein